MSDPKDVIDEKHENEEITPVSEPVSPEIDPTVSQETDQDSPLDITRVSAELAEMKDRFLRLYSEFDNYRKRTQKERIDLIKSANADVITALLPVLDDFERAVKYASSQENNDVNSGVHLIYNKLKSTLEAKGLKRMVSIGEEFNVDHHEAITNIPAPSDDMKGKVVDEAECGYFLNDKVIRHAKVIVGS